MGFFLNVFTEYSEFKDNKSLKELEPATCHQDATTVPARHVRDRIFELSPSHASVIYEIP